jgi:Ca-activated chloride channel homolog
MSARKMLALALLAGPPLTVLCGPTLAGTWTDLWSTHEQQGQKLLEGKHPSEAAQLFSDPKRRAYAEAQAGQYGKAAELLAPMKDADSQYNRGNALARGGKLQEALAAYDAALAASPGNEDVLRNRDLVAKALENQQHSQQGKDGSGKDSKGQQAQSQAGQPGHSGQQGQSTQQGQNGNQAQANAQNQATSGSQGQAGQQNQPGNQQQGASPTGAGNPSGQQAQANPAQNGKSAAANAGNSAQAQNPQQAAGAPAANPLGQRDQRNATALQQGQTSGTGTQRGPESMAESALVKGGVATDAHQSQPRSEQALALDQWLRSIPDDSGELLRRKFQIEHLMKKQGNEP